jgi:CNT family concentrative nucleoside transporter
MSGGMATLSGGMIAVYMGMGADPVALLASGIMSAPCSLYVAKLLVPETAVPQTMENAVPARDKKHTNILDAIASGATTGMALAINITAMIIAFLAFLTLIDYLLDAVMPDLSLQAIFAWLFNPIATLIGIEHADAPTVASLLGTKLVGNEFLAFAQLTQKPVSISPRSLTLATFALSGFANFSSVGIQLGAMGALAPNRRADIAQLGGRALFGGFLATLLNASIAGFLL